MIRVYSHTLLLWHTGQAVNDNDVCITLWSQEMDWKTYSSMIASKNVAAATEISWKSGASRLEIETIVSGGWFDGNDSNENRNENDWDFIYSSSS